jgi:hypothetical protein
MTVKRSQEDLTQFRCKYNDRNIRISAQLGRRLARKQVNMTLLAKGKYTDCDYIEVI